MKKLILFAFLALMSGCDSKDVEPPKKTRALSHEEKLKLIVNREDLLHLDGHPLQEIVKFIAQRSTEGDLSFAKAQLEEFRENINLSCETAESCSVKGITE